MWTEDFEETDERIKPSDVVTELHVDERPFAMQEPARQQNGSAPFIVRIEPATQVRAVVNDRTNQHDQRENAFPAARDAVTCRSRGLFLLRRRSDHDREAGKSSP